MKFNDILNLVGHVPFIAVNNAKYLYDLIVERKVGRILELGFAHGTATCFMAAALKANGGGIIDAVDLEQAGTTYHPNIQQLLEQTKLGDMVQIHRMRSGYPWFLHDQIKNQSSGGQCQAMYDLVIIDGPKNWTIDGAAFFMSDKLLKEGGVMIFDDVEWSYAQADQRRRSTDGIVHRDLGEEERTTPHIREVFTLLVMQHGSYSNFKFIENGDWAIAEKTKEGSQELETMNVDYGLNEIKKRVWLPFHKRVFRKIKRIIS